jgi:hypothetical protein
MPRLPLHKVLAWVNSDKHRIVDPQSTAEGTHFRRSSRLHLAIPITLTGQDESGEGFEESAQTLDVNRHGARITTTHELAPKAEVTIANPATGRACPAKIIWRGRSSQYGFECGVEYGGPVEPERIWAVESPPRDWAEGCAQPTADQRLEYLCQRARSDLSTVTTSPGTARVLEKAPAHSGVAVEEPSDLPVHEAQEPKPEAKPARQGNWSKANLTLLGLNLNQPRPSASPMSSATPVSEESAGGTEAAHLPENDATSESFSYPPQAEVDVGNDGDGREAPVFTAEVPTRPADTATDGLPNQIQGALPGAQYNVSQEVEGTSPAAREPSPDAELQRRAVERLTEELRVSGQEVVGQVREQLAHMTFKSLEILTQRAKTSTEECRNQLTKVLEQTVSRSKDTASGSIRRAAEEAVAELQSSQQKLEAGFETRASEYEQRFAELSASAAAGLERQSDAMVTSFQGRLDGALEEFEQKAAKRLQELIDRVSAQFEENWFREAEKQAATIAEKLSERLRVAGNVVVDEAKGELASVTKASLEAVTQATAKECHTQLDRLFREQSGTVSGAAVAAVNSIKLAAGQTLTELQTTGQRMSSSFEAGVQESQKRLSEQASRGMEAIERKSSAVVDGFENQLKSTLRGFEQKAGSELSELLRKTAAERREESARQLELHAVETEQKLKKGLTSSGEGIVEEARRLAGITQGALESLSQTAAEECRKRIEEFRRKSLAIQKEVDQLNQSNLQKIQYEIAPIKKSKSSSRPVVVTLAVFLLALVPAGAAIYLSTRPVLRLRSAPLAEFADAAPTWSAKRLTAEQQLAGAYWDLAVQDLQTKYPYGTSLPADPPSAFQVDPKAFAASGARIDFAASRTRYWQKLRDVWGQSKVWEESYGWNTDWIDRFLSSHGNGARPNAGPSATPASPVPAGANQ